MGNTETKNTNNRQVEVPHEKFKMIQVMESMEEMILTIPYEQKSDIVEWEKLLKNVRDCDPQFLLMPKKYMITEEGLCGSSGVIKIVYDCFIYSFEEQIKNHSEKFKHFQEAQIWYLLFAIISSIKQMDRLSMKVGDIRPHNIFVNENGQVKLAGVYSWPKEVENYLKTSYDKTITYLAPQELHQCRMGEKGKRSHIVGESFSVGLTLLHTCLLKQMDELYNVKKFEFNAQKLQYEINELKKLTYWNEDKESNEKYSQQLISIIIGLLDLDESKRFSTLDVFNELEPHAEQILNLREFEIPKFTEQSPAKQQHQSILVASHEHHGSSPLYSSIQKKEFNEPSSIAFDSNYPYGTSKNVNIVNQPFIPQRKTPQKRTKSKQKMQVSLSNEKYNLLSKTQQIPQIPRQSVSRQKFNSNPQVSFSVPKTQPQNNEYYRQVPSTYQYTAEFKTYDSQFQPFKPVIGSSYPQPSNLPQGNQRKYQAPSLNFTTSNYVPYQQNYKPSQTGDYSNPSTLGYITSQTPQFTYKPSVPQTQFSYKPSVPSTQLVNNPTGGSYPFTKNIQFTKSDYTIYEQSNINTELSHRPSFTASNQPGPSYSTNIYQTSTVKPVIPGQTSFGIGFVPGGETKISDEPSQLLKKIDQQLNKSKQMYSN